MEKSREKVPGTEDLYLTKFGTYTVRIYSSWLKEEKYLSTREKNLKKALKRARELKEEFLKKDPFRTRKTYGEIAIECFKVRMDDNRNSTVKIAAGVYENYLLPAFGHLWPEQVNDDRWLEQVSVWQKTKKRKTFFNIRKAAVQVDRYAFLRGHKPFRNDFPIKDPKAREGIDLPDDEFSTLVDACTYWYENGVRGKLRVGRDLIRGKRVRLFLLIGRYMGMRRAEITRLDRQRINLETCELHLRKEDTKTGRPRTMRIAPQVLPYLDEALRETRSFWLFPNDRNTGPSHPLIINRYLERLGKRCGIHIKPNDLRHTFETVKLMREKIDPLSVSIYVGSRLETIQARYLHPKAEDTKHVVEKGGSDLKISEGEMSDA